MTETFHAFEKRRWGETAAAYGRHYPALTDQAIDPLLDRAGVMGPVDCLDLACGPGTLAARAAVRGARVMGIDFAPEMIERAQMRHPAIAGVFRVGDAEQLELAPSSIDAVCINFGIMHMARPEAAIREAARVLRRDGKLSFTVWAEPEKSIAMQIIAAAMALANAALPLPAGEPFHRFCNPAEAAHVLAEAGFDRGSVVLEDLPVTWRFPESTSLYDLFATATTRSSLVLAAQTETTRRIVRDAFVRGVSDCRTADGEYAVPHMAVVVSARRAGA